MATDSYTVRFDIIGLDSTLVLLLTNICITHFLALGPTIFLVVAKNKEICKL